MGAEQEGSETLCVPNKFTFLPGPILRNFLKEFITNNLLFHSQ